LKKKIHLFTKFLTSQATFDLPNRVSVFILFKIKSHTNSEGIISILKIKTKLSLKNNCLIQIQSFIAVSSTEVYAYQQNTRITIAIQTREICLFTHHFLVSPIKMWIEIIQTTTSKIAIINSTINQNRSQIHNLSDKVVQSPGISECTACCQKTTS
jgi:hypothetical protein